MNKTMSWMVVTLAGLGLFGGMALAGQIDSPASPTNDVSSLGAMYTLNDIYNVMVTRTTNVALRGRATAFVEPSSGPTGTMHTLNEIMTLATHMAPVAKTGVTNSFVDGDDAWFATRSVGVAWPVPRFIAMPSGLATTGVVDRLTGLMWALDASNACGLAIAKTNWETAVAACTGLTYAGYSDWRMPNFNELMSLCDRAYFGPTLSDFSGTNQWTSAAAAAGNAFRNVIGTSPANQRYWSSTLTGATGATIWALEIPYGGLAGTVTRPASTAYYVWPVRGGR